MPAHTLLVINQLAWPSMLVEIDVAAMGPAGQVIATSTGSIGCLNPWSHGLAKAFPPRTNRRSAS